MRRPGGLARHRDRLTQKRQLDRSDRHTATSEQLLPALQPPSESCLRPSSTSKSEHNERLGHKTYRRNRRQWPRVSHAFLSLSYPNKLILTPVYCNTRFYWVSSTGRLPNHRPPAAPYPSHSRLSCTAFAFSQNFYPNAPRAAQPPIGSQRFLLRFLGGGTFPIQCHCYAPNREASQRWSETPANVYGGREAEWQEAGGQGYRRAAGNETAKAH